MQEFIEKLIARLEELRKEYYADYNTYRVERDLGNVDGLKHAIKIINQLAEEHSANTPQKSANGWIPCSERLPESGRRYLVSCVCHEKHTVWHAVYADSRGWHIHNGEPLNAEVIAWQPLPEPYKQQKEAKWKSAIMKHFTNVE